MIEVVDVFKSFGTPPTQVLQNISFSIQDGEFIALLGKSGSGKSTLMYIMSTLDTPTKGHISFDGKQSQTFTPKELHHFRNTQVGFVFQFHYLLPELTILENVLMPARKTKQHLSRRKTAISLLEEVGLGEKLNRLAGQLSGGEQQRVAIARALVMDPSYIFADEPTGNLDSANGDIVIQLLKRFNKEKKATIVMVTHDPDFAALTQRQILLVDGKLTSPK